MEIDDREIQSFSTAFQVLFPRAIRVARRIVGDPAAAEDIAAETMTRALAHWSRIGGDADYRAAWVARVAGNLAIDAVRRQFREPARPAHQDDSQELLAWRMTLVEAVRKLPPRQQEAIALRFLAGLSQAEVAAALGITPGSVARHVHRGLTSLRERLADEIPSGGAMKVKTQGEAAALAGTDTVLRARVVESEGMGWWRADIGVPALLRRAGQDGPSPDLTGEEIDCTVVRFVPDRELVLLAPVVSESERDLYERRHETISRLAVGQTHRGRVRAVVNFGAFVEINEIHGLIHISEMGDRRVNVGDTVNVEILETDIALQRVSLRLVNAA
jgi:RNA polymerase sigma factor (sigma-70 family)